MEARGSGMDSLPDEALLMIFRSLNVDDLFIAEQVCVRWKAVVSTCFATAKVLILRAEDNSEDGDLREKTGKKERNDMLKKLRRHGPSVKSLNLGFNDVNTKDRIDWMAEIGNAFPNLTSISLSNIAFRIKSLKDFPVKCSHITEMELSGCNLTDKKMATLLKGFPGLKRLELLSVPHILEECFRELGTSLEHFTSCHMQITQAGTSHIFSRCINLKSLVFARLFEFDVDSFTRFCKEAPLRLLNLICIPSLPKVGFMAISHLSSLEELELRNCRNVDSDVLIRISRGCPNLKTVILILLPRVRERGLKALGQCRNLISLRCLCPHVTDELLIALAKWGMLEALIFCDSIVTDRGLSAILNRCPRLHFLCVSRCSGVGDGTVDAAIAAVESRARSANLNQSPRDKCNEADEKSPCLLTIFLSGVGLDRYKDGFSRPLLSLTTAFF